MEITAEKLASLPSEKRKLVELKIQQDGARFNIFPVSFSQQRLWFLDQLDPNSHLYNIPIALKFTGRLEIEQLKAALEEIVKRHEILRTELFELNGNPYQRILSDIELDFNIEEIKKNDGDFNSPLIRDIISQIWHQPFNLQKAPLFRTKLLKINQNENILIFIIHHIITDGWSNQILIKEFGEIYNSLCKNEPPNLGPLKAQYADYSVWQKKWLQSDLAKKQLDYWEAELRDAPRNLDLPLDKKRPTFQSDNGDSLAFDVKSDVFEKLKALSTEQECTLFITNLAAFAVLLTRYSGQDEICLGTPIANRTKSQFDALIGFFVNTAVLRIDLSDNPTFRQLLNEVKQTVLRAFSNQEFPFERLVEKLAPQRDTSQTPLFQVMFLFQNNSDEKLVLDELEIEYLELKADVSTFDLTLGMQETNAGMSGLFEFATELFEKTTIADMADHLGVLLEKVVENPDVPISDIQVLAPTKQQEIVNSLNQTSGSFGYEKCLYELIDLQSVASPNDICISDRGRTITYGELYTKSNKLANYLVHKGVKSEQLVGISIDRSIELIVGLLGILKAGAAYVPLDPAYPQQRLEYMINDAGVKLILTQTHLSENQKNLPVELLVWEDEWPAIENESSDGPAIITDPAQLCYIIYTSGSTGKPKGVMVTHNSVVNHNLAAIEDYSITSIDKILQSSSISFDAAVEEIFPILIAGGTLVLRGTEPVLSVVETMSLAKKEKVTILDFPTAYWNEIAFELAKKSVVLPGSVRLLLIGGEKATLERLKDWYNNGGERVQFVNTYGPTEATIVSTIFDLSKSDQSLGSLTNVPIGRPISNLTNYVLDRRLSTVPIGVVGELYIGGAGVARGYLNRPDLSAEKFIPDPFSELPGRLMYRSGDLVRIQRDGNIAYVGRIDHQVKIRGFRIELGEIEDKLRGHPNVKECVVLDVNTEHGGKKIVAYVVLDSADSNNISQIKTYLTDNLPQYMVPANIVGVESIPKTPSGKIDKKALPSNIEDDSRTIIEPRTPTEEKLAGLFKELLDIHTVSIDDNFFDLGGHSLIATQFVSRVRDVFELSLPLAKLFQEPTVAGLAKVIDEKQISSNGFDRPPLVANSTVGEKTLSFAQQRLWFLNELEPGSTQYIIPDALKISGPLDIQSLEQSFNIVVQRQESLRTCFKTKDGKATIYIEPELFVPLDVADLIGLEDQQEKITAETKKFGAIVFDLSKAPLFKIKLLQVANEEFILLLTMHHIISDGWSFNVLVNELTEAYFSCVNQRPLQLSKLNIQYSDFALWQRNWLKDQALEKQLLYWKNQLADMEGLLKLPTDRPRPAFQTYNGDHIVFTVDAELSHKLNLLSKKHEVSLFMTMMAAFQTLLYKYSHQQDICVGTPVANRTDTELEKIIGFFINTLVIRSRVTDHLSFSDLLRNVFDVCLGAFAHQDLPFEKIVDAVQPERDTSHSPLFQVMFVLQNIPHKELEVGGLSFQQMSITNHQSNFDLTLAMEEIDGRISGAFEYNTDLFDQSTINRMIEHFQQLLSLICQNPDLKLSQYNISTQNEVDKLLNQWNATDHHLPNECLQSLIETRVATTPDKIALKWRNESVRYQELNAKANQLANYLVENGVGADDVVGISIERSPNMIIGLLGILKAGAGYLPLDPQTPKDRYAYMIENAGAKIVLTQESLKQELPVGDFQIVLLDSQWEEIAGYSQDNVPTRSFMNSTAYVIYTSGSTGIPKGVAVTHRSVVNHNFEIIRKGELTSQDRVLQFVSINFDAAVEEIFPCLISGATLVLREDGLVTSIEEFTKLIERERITFLDLPTTYWHEWVHELAAFKQQVPESVRLVIVGGDKASQDRYVAWQNAAGQKVKWLNTYGPTEGTVIATMYDPIAENWEQLSQLPIGRPIANSKIYILDSELNMTPVGVPGELHIGGLPVARGYINAPEITAEKFIPDHLSENPGGRLYKTGDLARYLAEGTIEFLGRTDFQIKVRGFRVELGDVEASLLKHPDVKDCLVVCHPQNEQDKKLIGYFTSHITEPDVNNIREFLSNELQSYMIPHFFVHMDEFPKTAGGKISRKELPLPEYSDMQKSSDYVAPESDEEKKMADIWKDILRIDKVGVNDNFFELGGDSILSIQVVAKANQAGLYINPRHIFEFPTIAGLVRVADEKPQIRAEQGPVVGDVPLTPIQHWFFEQQFQDKHHWNQSILFKISDHVDKTMLQDIVSTLLTQHDMLNSRYEFENEQVRQYIIDQDESNPLEFVDLSTIDENDYEIELEKECNKIQASLDLSNGPVIKFAHFNFGKKTDSRLLIAAHHLVIDAVSWRIILEDLQSLYGQVSVNQEPLLPPKTTSFQYWAEKLVEYSKSEEMDKQIAFWESLSEKNIEPVFTDFPENLDSNIEKETSYVDVSLNEVETSKLLGDVQKAYNTQINEILFSAMLLAQNRWTGQRNICFYAEGHGRESLFNDVDLSRTVGWFTTLFPVYLELPNSFSIGEIIKSVKEQNRQIPLNGLGYDLMRYLAKKENTPIVEPQICFNYLGQMDQALESNNSFSPSAENKGLERSEKSKRNYLIDINASVFGSKLQVNFAYCHKIHNASTIQRFALEFITGLREIIDHCTATEEREFTPSDFELTNLNKRQLDSVLNKLQRVR